MILEQKINFSEQTTGRVQKDQGPLSQYKRNGWVGECAKRGVGDEGTFDWTRMSIYKSVQIPQQMQRNRLPLL